MNSLRWIPVEGQNRSNSDFSEASNTTAVLTKRSIKYGNSMQAAWGILMDYCRRSTIHGIRYMVERKRSWPERLMWVCIFVGAIYTCSRLISNIWLKWETTPVIVSFSEKSTPIWQIPFPSVVICPESKSSNEMFNFTQAFYQVIDNHSDDKFDNLSTTEYEYLQTLAQICDIDLAKRLKFERSERVDVLNAMAQMAPNSNDSVPFGKWKNIIFYPDGYFTAVITDLGVCHQFNGLHESEILRYSNSNNISYDGSKKRNGSWSLDAGYKTQFDDNSYPERVVAAGVRGGLFLALFGLLQDLDFLCHGAVQGFSILLLSPDELPAANKHYIRVPFNQEILLSVIPNLVTTSEGLRDYSPERRQCFFNEERYLKFFKAYTQNNCMFECLTNFTYAKCGCVKFSMPRTEDMAICQAADIKCYYEAEDDLLRHQFEIGLKGGPQGSKECNCMPACTSLVYDVEISQADFDVYKVLQAYNDSYLAENPGLRMGRLSIFFKEQQFLTIKRSELYGTTDFLASSGGLLGLFLGISALSIVELIYFCTVRLISNLKMRRASQAATSASVEN